MSEEDPASHVPHHHRRRQRAKWWLRFMPRRAVLHRYPLIGSFAHHIRDRDYLWSFRTRNTRPAYYLGSVLSFLPVMGIQLPVALILSLLFRANFMVLGGLQFITNPFTAAPIYYATYQVGKETIAWVRPPNPAEQHLQRHEEIRPEEADALASSLADEIIAEDTPQKGRWRARIQSALGGLVVGGVIFGVTLGVILDVTDTVIRRGAAHHHRTHPRPPRKK